MMEENAPEIRPNLRIVFFMGASHFGRRMVRLSSSFRVISAGDGQNHLFR
jgi:hypothetical protein